MNLAAATRNKTYRIASISDPLLLERLNELGVFLGSEVALNEMAPSGCPLVFAFGRLRLSLRKESAKQIVIEEILNVEAK